MVATLAAHAMEYPPVAATRTGDLAPRSMDESLEDERSTGGQDHHRASSGSRSLALDGHLARGQHAVEPDGGLGVMLRPAAKLDVPCATHRVKST